MKQYTLEEQIAEVKKGLSSAALTIEYNAVVMLSVLETLEDMQRLRIGSSGSAGLAECVPDETY